MWMLNHLVNPLVRALLRSPLHPLLSRRLLLLRVSGRRSGRTLEVPVGYADDGSEVLVTVGAPEHKQWWRNIDDSTRVTVVLRGHERLGLARLEQNHGSTSVHISLSAESRDA
jgi:deazaflavin-dependent oxidoreductase (nitroreductase family)